MNEWMEKGMVTCVVDEKEKVMKRQKHWIFSVRVVGNANKNVECFIKVKTAVKMHDKNCAWDKCKKENTQISKKIK